MNRKGKIKDTGYSPQTLGIRLQKQRYEVMLMSIDGRMDSECADECTKHLGLAIEAILESRRKHRRD